MWMEVLSIIVHHEVWLLVELLLVEIFDPNTYNNNKFKLIKQFGRFQAGQKCVYLPASLAFSTWNL
jgi:hypothetical protein